MKKPRIFRGLLFFAYCPLPIAQCLSYPFFFSNSRMNCASASAPLVGNAL
jgi:hypothetical protein